MGAEIFVAAVDFRLAVVAVVLAVVRDPVPSGEVRLVVAGVLRVLVAVGLVQDGDQDLVGALDTLVATPGDRRDRAGGADVVQGGHLLPSLP